MFSNAGVFLVKGSNAALGIMFCCQQDNLESCG